VIFDLTKMRLKEVNIAPKLLKTGTKLLKDYSTNPYTSNGISRALRQGGTPEILNSKV
jgi:hypothetical protein